MPDRLVRTARDGRSSRERSGCSAQWDSSGTIRHARDDTALAHGAGVEQETDTPGEAYAPFPKWERGRPGAWDSLPWNR